MHYTHTHTYIYFTWWNRIFKKFSNENYQFFWLSPVRCGFYKSISYVEIYINHFKVTFLFNYSIIKLLRSSVTRNLKNTKVCSFKEHETFLIISVFLTKIKNSLTLYILLLKYSRVKLFQTGWNWWANWHS